MKILSIHIGTKVGKCLALIHGKTSLRSPTIVGPYSETITHLKLPSLEGDKNPGLQLRAFKLLHNNRDFFHPFGLITVHRILLIKHDFAKLISPYIRRIA